MATLAEARAELVTALETAGLRVTDNLAGFGPPGALVYGDGVDVAHIGRGEVLARFRVTLIAGSWDGAGSAGTLAGLVATTLGALAAMTGWLVGDVEPDSLVSVAGSSLLGADLTASRMVTVA